MQISLMITDAFDFFVDTRNVFVWKTQIKDFIFYNDNLLVILYAACLVQI